MLLRIGKSICNSFSVLRFEFVGHELHFAALWDFVGFCHSERSEESQLLRDASLRSA
jgi:hypothetical protein